METTGRLTQEAIDVCRKVEALPFLQASHLLKTHVNDFVSGAAFVESLATSDDYSHLRPAIHRLKDIGREIVFTVSADLPKDVSEAIASLMRNTATVAAYLLPSCTTEDDPSSQSGDHIESIRFSATHLVEFVTSHATPTSIH